MGKCYREELVGVFGCPIDENPTVVIAMAAFKELGVNYRYQNFEVKPEDLETAMKAVRAFGMKGIHLTIPHKVEVLKYLDGIADDAAVMGAVNTVCVRDGKLYGENTDGKGFIKSLEDEQVAIAGKKAVLLGAGGAARAIAVELANHGIREIVIVNRTAERGTGLAALVNEKTKGKAVFVHWDHTFKIPEDADILVNCTNIGLYPDAGKPDIDYDSLPQDLVVCDIIPNPPTTGFLTEARERGLKTLDGLGMLVNQGALSFEMWTGRACNVEVMRAAMLAEFKED